MATNTDGFHGDNPITNWVFEIVPLHGGAVTAEDRYGRLEEMADRLKASDTVVRRAHYAAEAREKHENMVDMAVFRDALEESEKRALMDTFEGLVDAWEDGNQRGVESAHSAYTDTLDSIQED